MLKDPSIPPHLHHTSVDLHLAATEPCPACKCNLKFLTHIESNLVVQVWCNTCGFAATDRNLNPEAFTHAQAYLRTLVGLPI